MIIKKKYQIVYADPPWSWETYSSKGRKKTSDNHYPLLGLDKLRALPVNEITDKDCALFMWVQDAHLESALMLGSAWGFTYKTIGFMWDKQNFGMGYWTRKGAEVCLLFTKGHPKRVSANVRQFLSERARKHSQKPNEIRGRITQLLGGLPRIELFARQKVEGWDCWGNEVKSDIEL